MIYLFWLLLDLIVVIGTQTREGGSITVQLTTCLTG